MRTGERRKHVILQSEQPTPDGAGGYTLSWTNFATVWADIVPATGEKLFVSGHLEGHVTHKVTIRYLTGVTIDMRILWGGRTFNIRAVTNVEERNHILEILVEEGVAT
jgi:SPP1 family predicted phage head-tail adaptor